jgi:hypothetical protein
MSFIQRLFGTPTRPAPAQASQLHSQLSSSPSQQAVSNTTTRRELLRVVLRDTLHRQGIPADWINAELLSSTSRTGERTVHWRLQVKHWDVRILTHSVALQHALIKRVTTFDPLASTWLSGISWQFALEDESVCPPLPHPGSWTSSASPEEPPADPVAAADGGVIEGPVRIADTPQPAGAPETDAARADLDQLLAIRDADFRQHAQVAAGTWVKTEPAKL